MDYDISLDFGNLYLYGGCNHTFCVPIHKTEFRYFDDATGDFQFNLYVRHTG